MNQPIDENDDSRESIETEMKKRNKSTVCIRMHKHDTLQVESRN